MLVEADIIVRHALAEYLRECGFTVLEAANGDEARTVLSSREVEVDVVLADMATPGSGFVLRQWIISKNLSPEVILAGSLEKAVANAGTLCHDEGPAVTKPYQHHLVLDHIRRAIARRGKT
jgi:DNA-binding response OmpR family regulator